MAEVETSESKQFLRALLILKEHYREALLEHCDDNEINQICECILKVFKEKITVKETSKSIFNICKFNCFLSTDAV